jgi:hypothetical protein
VYAGTGGDLYAAGEGRAPIKVGDLADLVFGREMLGRFSHAEHAGYIFATQEAKILADCLQDDTELDLPADKARRLIETGKRIYLSRNILTYALLEAVRIVGYRNERGTVPVNGGAWTMRRIFGAIS